MPKEKFSLKTHTSFADENAYQIASANFLLGPLVVVGQKGKKKIYARQRSQGILREDVMAWHTPNGGMRNMIVAIMLWKMGTMKGVPDWSFLWPEIDLDSYRRYNLGYIELKNGAGTQDTEQKVFQKYCESVGIPYGVAKNDLEPIWLLVYQFNIPMSPMGLAWGRHLIK